MMQNILGYIGPGMAGGAAVLVIVIFVVVLVSIGLLFWYPIKRFFKKLFGKKN